MDKTTQTNLQPLLPPRALRISEAAKYLSVTPWYIEVAIRTRRLPAVRMGRHYVLLREDLDLFIDHHRANFEVTRTAGKRPQKEM
jgi:excisionase family DNA binding protein